MTDATTAATAETGEQNTAATGTTETGAAARWHDDARFEPFRPMLTAKGLDTLDDPMEALTRALDMQANAEKKLGKSADQLLTRPEEGQTQAEWMAANRAAFGLPEAADGYEIKQPESWPKEAQWDSELEAEARRIAHEEGLSGAALQKMTDAYAGAMQRMLAGGEEQLAEARKAMMGDLEKEWGGETGTRIARAQQAASTVATHLGLDRDGLAAIAQTLRAGAGDAGVIRLFDLMGDLLGDDKALGVGKGAAALGTTPEQASAELAALRKPGGEYYEAVKANDRTALARLRPQIERLSKVAAG